MTTVLYFLLTASDYHICIFWPPSCTFYLRLLITTFVSFDHCLVLPTYSFWLPHLYLLTTVLYFLLTASDYHICIFWPPSCTSYLRLLITTLYLLTTVLYFLLTASDYHFCIFWPPSCISYLRLLITTFVSFEHRLVLSTYGFWLPLLYLLTTVLYFLFTASDYHICIFWPPSCTSYLRFLITTFGSFDHCLVLPTYGFWLPLLYLLTTVLYLLLTASDYHFCIFWPLSCTSYLRLLITTFVSFDHCLVLPTYGFWLPLLYLLTTVLYFLLTASDYHICIFWPPSCTFYLRLLITTFVSFDHCLVLPIYGFWLPHLYLLTTVLYFLLTVSDYHIWIFWPLSCTSYLRLLITTFVSFDHRLVPPTYGLWLPLLYLLTTVLYFLLTASDYHICIFWPLSSTSYLRLLITTFVSFDHCLVFPTYGFWLPHLYLLTTVLYFLLTASDYHFCIFWPLSCTSYLRLLITTFVSFDHCLVLPTYGFWLPLLYLLTTVLYFLLTASDYHICIFWPPSCISYLLLLIITFVSFDHRLVLSTYGFWLQHLYLLTTVLYFLLTASDYHICIFWPPSCTFYLRFWLQYLYLLTTVLYFILTASDYHFCIFWQPSCTFYLRLLITTFVSFDHCLVFPTYGFWLPLLYLLTTVLYFLLTASDYHFCIFWPPSCISYLRLLIITFVSFDHCIVLPTYGFWLPHLFLLTTVLYFLLTASDYHICIFWPSSNFLLTASDYHICIFWPLSCTFYLRLLITTFVSFDHCLVFPTYGFWLPHLYLLTTVLYFLLTASDYHFCIFWPLSCTSYLRLLITTFVSFDHRLVPPTYGFWLPFLYLLSTVLYYLLTASDYHICIFWPLSSTSYLRLLITTFVSFDHCLVFPTCGFWLPHLYLLTTVLYFLLTASDYHICIFWPPSCTFYLRLLITTFVSFDHCLVLPTYSFWLPHLYLLTTVLYFLLTASDYNICIFWPPSCTSYLRLLITTLYLLTTVLYFLLTASDYHFCIFWPLSCISYLRLLITTFVSFDHCLVFPTYGFWLPLLYLLTTVLYFLLTASDYHICIFWPLYCTSYLRLLITTFVSFDHRLVFPTYASDYHICIFWPSSNFLLTASDYHICIFWPLSCTFYLRLLITTFVSFDHRLVLPTYGFWLPLLYLLTTVLYFLLTASDYHICIFWPLSCTFYLRFWLPHLYLLTTVLYFLLTASDYHFCIFWPLSCTFYLRLLITTFVSFDHRLVLPTYDFWLPHLYLLTTVLYFLLTASDYYICIFWPPSCTSYLRLLITTFVSFDHCLVLSTYGFWLPHLYLLTTVLYFILTASDYHFCIFWPPSCTFYLRLLITTLYLLTTVLYFLLTASDYHFCIFWPPSCISTYGFWLPLLYLLTTVLYLFLVFHTYGFWLPHLYLLTTVLYFLLTVSDYHFCIFWPLSCTSYLRLLITTFVSFDNCLVFPTYGFWLPLLYLLTTVLYFLLTASDYHICSFWPPSCISYLRLLIITFVSFDHCIVLPTYGFWLPHLYSFDHRLVFPTYGFWLPHLYLLTTV